MFLSAHLASWISVDNINSKKNKGKNKDMLYGVNVVMWHPKKAEFLNPAPDSFKEFGGKTNFQSFYDK